MLEVEAALLRTAVAKVASLCGVEEYELASLDLMGYLADMRHLIHLGNLGVVMLLRS